jgi:hypothetical protein
VGTAAEHIPGSRLLRIDADPALLTGIYELSEAEAKRPRSDFR